MGTDKSISRVCAIHTKHTKTCQRSLIMSINFHILHYTNARVRIQFICVCLFLLKIELAQQIINWTRAHTPRHTEKKM